MTENETHELENKGGEIKYRNALCPDCKEVEIKPMDMKYYFGPEYKNEIQHLQCPNCGEKYAEWI